MAERHATLNSRALATLLNPNDRKSKIVDGFGDFCFAPAATHCTDCHWSQDPLTLLSSFDKERINNRGTKPTRFDACYRTFKTPESTFPILELPDLVRDLIYGFLVGPLRNPWENDCIRVTVGVVYDRRCHPFRNGYSLSIPMSVGRTDIYGMSPKDKHYHLEMEEFDTLRALSQVNHQIRAELGAVFWRNVHIDIDHWEYLFIDFLEDRPSVWNGIKKLRMEWDTWDSPRWLDCQIIPFCEFIAEHLELEELVFHLSTTESVAKYLLAHDDVQWVKAFKKMKVSDLQLSLSIDPEEDLDSDFEDDFVAAEIDDIDEFETDEELEGAYSGGSEDGSSDIGVLINHGGSDEADFLDDEEKFEEARESLVKVYTPLLTALLRSTIVQTSEKDRYLNTRTLPVAPPGDKNRDS